MKKKIFVSIILYVFLSTNIVAYAATPEEVGLYVASFAKNFCETYTINYSWGTSDKTYGDLTSDSYTGECVSFCRRMYRDSVNLSETNIPYPSGNEGVYNSPADTQAGKGGNSFEYIGCDDLDLAMPGDILECYHHDIIFVGNVGSHDDVIANDGWNTPNADDLARGMIALNSFTHIESGSCGFTPHERMGSGSGGCHFRIWRITKEAAESLGDASTFDAGGDLISGVKKVKNTSNGLNMSNFYYNGIPDGKYSVTKGFFEILIDSLLQIMDWIIGLLTMISRMVWVGWAAIIEWVINISLKGLTGGDQLDSVPVSSTEVDSGDNITIEKIVFNKIGIFDVNFFNFNDEDPALNP